MLIKRTEQENTQLAHEAGDCWKMSKLPQALFLYFHVPMIDGAPKSQLEVILLNCKPLSMLFAKLCNILSAIKCIFRH